MAKNKQPMEEVLYGIFYDLFRITGSSLNPTQTEQLRLRCELLSRELSRMMKSETGAMLEKLQEATKAGFVKTDQEFRSRDARLEELENKVKTLNRQRFELDTDVTELKKAIKALKVPLD